MNHTGHTRRLLRTVAFAVGATITLSTAAVHIEASE